MTNATDHGDGVVAVLGAGPAGLVTARWLLERGFEPVVFEASGELGGQWNAAAPTSATWPGMVTNTSRIMTAFSDLEHPEGTPTYPSREAMHRYLRAYAERFGLGGRIRFHARVDRLSREADGRWTVAWTRTEGDDPAVPEAHADRFARVVVATGRQTRPEMPEVPGLDTFSGRFGARHTCAYPGSESYRGATVVVAGCSISALEIATDLAHAGADVVAAYRRQRYVLPKVQMGVPTEHVMFTRSAALAAERLPPEAVAGGLRDKILSVGGSPDQWGARAPDPDVHIAGITQAQGFLPAVAEGRIRTVPWFEAVEGDRVRFGDGTEVVADGILFGTGFRLHVPFLSEALVEALRADDRGLDLVAETFHPDLPDLAFVGQYNLIGPYFPVLELQARWLSGTWGGTSTALPAPEQHAALRGGPLAPLRGASVPMHVMALAFARLGGVEPRLEAWPELERALLFGPLSPASLRLSGPDPLDDAAARTAADAAAFGHVTTPQFAPDEAGLRAALFDQAPENSAAA